MADLAHDICMYNNHPRDTVCIWTEYYVHTSSAYTYTNDPGMYDMNQVPVGVITQQHLPNPDSLEHAH